MATDIVDKDLKALRNARWKRAFDDTDRAHESPSVSQNRKATIVIEHLIQASDVQLGNYISFYMLTKYVVCFSDVDQKRAV